MTAKPEIPSSYRVRLTRLASNNANLRTPSMDGVTAAMPEVGHGFRLIGKSLTEGGSFRMIHTSKVIEVSGETFKTENSEYRLELLTDEEEE